ncbi:cache domain-containing protein [Dongia soli]|uniref:Cache domain-containing protein n=1 Tax=Dongia soli TaxID=600628 RepID=A0ABU5EGJ6_9PROT|nr:cache domain-containing protein [Dongia soli]MDY0884994.1 cache domain-containing protein [Dongia soli]
MLKRLTIARKLSLVPLAFSLILLGVTTYVLYDMRSGMIEDRKSKLRALIETALSTVNRYGDMAAAGTLSVEDAQRQALDALSQTNFDGKNYFFIFDRDGILKMHPTRKDQIGTNILQTSDPQATANFTGYLQAATTQPTLQGFTTFPGRRPGSTENNTPKLFLSAFDKHWNWVISTGIFIDDVNELFMQRAGLTIGLLLLGLLIGIVLTALLSRSITRPLNRTVDALEGLREGRFDTVVEVDQSKTEIGRLTSAFLHFRETMRESETLRQQQAEAEKRAEADRRASFLKFADEFEASVGSAADSLAKDVGDTSATLATLSKSAQISAEGTQRVNSAANSVADNVQTVAAAAQQLAGSIVEIGRQIHVARDVVQNAQARSTQTETQVAALAEKVQAIGSVIDIINGIANQTNLLALNATIEAARAGEAGKGFTVVASEVKALANQTTSATDDIRRNIEAVREATREAVSAVRGIASSIGELESTTNSIAAAIEEQNAATSEISRNTNITADETQSITKAIADVTASVSSTDQSARSVDRSSAAMRQKSEVMRSEIRAFLDRIRTA